MTRFFISDFAKLSIPPPVALPRPFLLRCRLALPPPLLPAIGPAPKPSRLPKPPNGSALFPFSLPLALPNKELNKADDDGDESALPLLPLNADRNGLLPPSISASDPPEALPMPPPNPVSALPPVEECSRRILPYSDTAFRSPRYAASLASSIAPLISWRASLALARR